MGAKDWRSLARARSARPYAVLHRRYVRPGEKGGGAVEKTKRGKGTKLMVVADGFGLPLAVSVASASPHEITLIDQTLESRFVEEKSKRLIGDRTYDSDPLDAEFGCRSIEMIAPEEAQETEVGDRRKLGRYKRHWKVERLFAWLGNFRRLVVRYERRAENYLGFLSLGACLSYLGEARS